MKQLTTDQINHIEFVLRNDYSFEHFDDLRIELLDHIASDVEVLMENNSISFEEALPVVLYKWNDEISWDRNSKYNRVPKMVSKLWKKLDWKYISITISLVVLMFVVSQFYRNEVWITYSMYFIGVIGFALGIYLLQLFKRNRFNTVLSMYAEDKLLGNIISVVFGIIINGILNYYDGNLLSNPGFVAIVYSSITLLIKTILMRKNIKIENQLLKVI